MKRHAENDMKKRKNLKNFGIENLSPDAQYEEGEVGIIESVSVQNFMCHENYTLNFGSHMNFIIGQNGSGKSAILTAIILALGGKSSSTDRFTSIKGFVKSGKNKGKIEIVLRNKGNFAYKPEVYGEKIVVIREFNKEGVGSYKIKSESGTICSNQKSELINIVEAMDIMVECPVCVLTQATSKRFLISKDAKAERLFEFFYKGTGLETLENKYKDMTIMKEEAEMELDKKKQTLPDLKKDLHKWKRFLDASKKIVDYKNEMIWAGVIEMEKQVQEKEATYKRLEKEFEDHKKDMESCKKSYVEKSSELDELNKQKSNFETEMAEYRKTLEEIKLEYEDHASTYRKTKGTLQRLENEKVKLEDDILDLEKCINEKRTKDRENLEEEENKRMALVKKLKDKNAILDQTLNTLKETINTKRNEESNISNRIDNLRAEVNQHLFKVKSMEDNLVKTKNVIKNKVNAFGEQTEKVLLDIKNEKRFIKPPVGPIGMYLDIKESRWAAAVEFAIGSSLLNSFCVDNHNDSRLLRDILKRYYNTLPSIIVSPYESQMFDVQHGRVQSPFPSVLDMLTIKDYRVANCLIDQTQIEKKILVGNEKDRPNLMNNPPKNCSSAYFINCDQICFHPSRIYSYGKRPLKSRLSAIRSEVIGELQKEIKEKKDTIMSLEKQIVTMIDAVKSYPSQIDSFEGEWVKVSTEYKRNEMEIAELQHKEETKNVDCPEEDLENLTHSCEQTKEKIKQCSETVFDLNAKIKTIVKKRDDQRDLLTSLHQNYQSLLTKICDVSKLKESFASGKTKYELELKSKENECRHSQNLWEDYREKLQIASSRAENTCPRINTDRSYEELARLIEQLNDQVKKKSECDRETLIKKYQEKLENIRRAEIELKKIERYLLRIDEMLKHRNGNFHKIRKNTELLISLTFTTILSGNGYLGRLSFAHDKRQLLLKVSPRPGDEVRKNHNSLSGGERSFVTIAFLLALWERTKMPFRILDEYDVFMDSSNRQLSIDLLYKKAVEMARTQFIFLSPLELTRMPASNYISIMKMAPPKRKADEDVDSPKKKRS